MGTKAFLIDTSKCIACKACQVACKQWNELPAEKTVNQGTFQNPPDLSAVTWTLVRFKEVSNNGKMSWNFFKDQCRHCLEPPCKLSSTVNGSIIQDETGAVIYTKKTRYENFEDIMCPYNIPRQDKNTMALLKCTMCVDRVKNGLLPACVKACPTGTMQFGDRKEMLEKGQKRVEELKPVYEHVSLIDMDDVSVFYLLVDEPEMYGMIRHEDVLSTFA
ncbi:formate dehydrogenase [Candidatus Poribacteria bacterium]|nr:formate dehydrogenase [Candidatus Poribacteria bacterium]